MDTKTQLTITKLDLPNLIVLKQIGGSDFFVSTTNSIIISPGNLAFVLKFMVENGILDYKIIEGVLKEFHGQD
jgi:hypothetical protein